MVANSSQISHLSFVDEQEKQYFAEAVVGQEMLDFLNSTTGQFLHGCAKQVKQECVAKMFELDPYSAKGKKEHERIKREAWCAQHFMKWCAEAIQTGRDAETLLNDYRDD